jgi:hypothetical protein
MVKDLNIILNVFKSDLKACVESVVPRLSDNRIRYRVEILKIQSRGLSQLSQVETWAMQEHGSAGS